MGLAGMSAPPANPYERLVIEDEMEDEQKELYDTLIDAGVKERFAERALERGLTAEDVAWNERLGRPINFVETVHPEAEEARRKEWEAKNGNP